MALLLPLVVSAGAGYGGRGMSTERRDMLEKGLGNWSSPDSWSAVTCPLQQGQQPAGQNAVSTTSVYWDDALTT